MPRVKSNETPLVTAPSTQTHKETQFRAARKGEKKNNEEKKTPRCGEERAKFHYLKGQDYDTTRKQQIKLGQNDGKDMRARPKRKAERKEMNSGRKKKPRMGARGQNFWHFQRNLWGMANSV